LNCMASTAAYTPSLHDALPILEQGFGLVADVDHLLRVPQLQAVEAGVGEARSAQVDVPADPAGVLGMIGLVVIEDLGDELPEAPGVEQPVDVEDSRQVAQDSVEHVREHRQRLLLA